MVKCHFNVLIKSESYNNVLTKSYNLAALIAT